MPLKPPYSRIRLRMGCGETLAARTARPWNRAAVLRVEVRRSVGSPARSQR